MILKQHSFDRTNHKVPFSFDVAENFVTFSFHYFYQLSKL